MRIDAAKVGIGQSLDYIREVKVRVSNTIIALEEMLQPEVPPSIEPLFSEDFEAYPVGSAPTGGRNGFQWTGSRYAQVSSDISHSGKKSLRFAYGPTEPNGQSHMWAEQRFSHPKLTEYWAEYYIYFPNGTEGLGARYEHAANNANNKFWTYWGPGYSSAPAGNASLWGRGGGDSNVGFINVGGAWSGAGLGPLVVGNADRGRWMQIRVHIKIPDFGQSNGVLRLWKDGQLVTQRLNEPCRVTSPSENYLSAGYILGYDNARFVRDTFIYVDDLKFYIQNPGWQYEY